MVRRSTALCPMLLRGLLRGLVGVLLGACRPDSAGLGASGTGELEDPSTGTSTTTGETTGSTGPIAPDTTTSTGVVDSGSTGPGTTGDASTSTTGTSSDGVDTEPQPQQVEYCTVANLPIPDNALDGVTSSINVDLLGGGTIVSMQLVIQASHSYVGDLRFDLRKSGEAAIIVIDQPGGGMCNGNGIDVVLHDGGTAPVEDSCVNDGGGTPALGGELIPETTFDPMYMGNELIGTWRLQAFDRAEEDTGTLDAWCLRFTYW
ncbi:hypothetical protein [Paraliomyxa miuraensis]|uniref:hypothetical protein n=1 Tax=Paraliomyxa miuraensis TaxID=376150 RepID=UPI002257696A|nr:hypothetical protein [Paraliomyxa miuraensis]MCX4246759.1 hypothetical protein [Paraliomyxa miuraensis]